MSYPHCYTIESVAFAPNQYYGRFVLGQFAPGQGLTVANSLRRSLLTELTGCTFAFVYIPGARYEYESLPGLKECVLDILLNLKRVRLNSRLRSHPPVVTDLTIVGPKVVRGRDLRLPPFVTVVNPDQLIVTVTEMRTLVLRLVIVSGGHRDPASLYDRDNRGYVRLTHADRDVGVPGGSESAVSLTPWRKRRLRRAVTATRRGTDNERRPVSVVRKRSARRSEVRGRRRRRGNLKRRELKSGRVDRRARAFAHCRKLTRGRWDRPYRTRPKLRGTDDPRRPVVGHQHRSSRKPVDRSVLRLGGVDGVRGRRKCLSSEIAAESTRGRPRLGSCLRQCSRSGYFPLHYDVGPVTGVNYTIESPANNSERIGLEVWTDGSLEPARALGYGVRAMIQLFLPLQRRRSRDLGRVASGRDRYRRRLKLAQGSLRLGAGAVRQRVDVWHRLPTGTTHQPVRRNQLQTLRALDQLGRRVGAEIQVTAKRNARLRRATDNDRRKDRRVMRARRRWFYDHRRRLRNLTRAVKRGRGRLKKRGSKFRHQPQYVLKTIRERRYRHASHLVCRWRRLRRYPPSLAMDIGNLGLGLRTTRALLAAGLTSVDQLFVPDSVLRSHYALPLTVIRAVVTSLVRRVAVMILNHRDRPGIAFRRVVKQTKVNRRKGRPDRSAKGRPDRSAKGRPDRSAKGRPDRSAKGRPDRSAKGRPDRSAKIKHSSGLRLAGPNSRRLRRRVRSVPRDDRRCVYIEDLRSLLASVRTNRHPANQR